MGAKEKNIDTKRLGSRVLPRMLDTSLACHAAGAHRMPVHRNGEHEKTVKIWPDGGIGHPCGHASSFDDGCVTRDHFACPVCGLRWRVDQAPPIQHPSGWIEPGKRTRVIEPQMELPTRSLRNVKANL